MVIVGSEDVEPRGEKLRTVPIFRLGRNAVCFCSVVTSSSSSAIKVRDSSANSKSVSSSEESEIGYSLVVGFPGSFLINSFLNVDIDVDD